jgi:hypothetical protein
VWRSFDDAAKDAFDDPADFQRNDLFNRVPSPGHPSVRADCGRDDPFYDNVRLLADRARLESTGFGDGSRDDRRPDSKDPAR